MVMLARTGQRKWSLVGLVKFSNPFSNLEDRHHKFKKEDIDDQLMKGKGVDCGKERY